MKRLLLFFLLVSCVPAGDECQRAGGTCLLGGAQCPGRAGPEDCNPERNPGGGHCCLPCPAGQSVGDGGVCF
jgi:hypothetical protein